MKSLSYKMLLVGVFLFVTVFYASSQSLMSLMRSQEGNLGGEVEKNWERKAKDLILYNDDYCDFYIVVLRGKKAYDVHPGRNLIVMGRSRKKSDYTYSKASVSQISINKFSGPLYKRDINSYRLRYYPGRFPKKLDKSFPYALPVKHGKETSWRTDSLETCLTLNFSIPEGDTVYATRSGTVCKAGDGRQVLVYHSDCTFAAYLMLERKFVSPGDEIHTGEPIGVASPEGVSISFYYLDKTQFRRGEKVADYPYAHFVPVFRTDEGDVRPEEGKPYRAVTDDVLITQEMSKRERSQYLKDKK